MSFGPAYRNDFVNLNDVHKYNSATALGSPTDSGGPLQKPRIPSNVEIVTDSTATPDPNGVRTLIRVWSRLAGSGEYRGGGYWANGGFSLTKGQQKYGDYVFRVRSSYGKNTKGVLCLWPVGDDGWHEAAPGSGDEEDIYEWYTGNNIANGAGDSNLHFRAADGTTAPSYQWHIPLGIADWTVWHEIHFIWLPTSLDLFIDGVRPFVASNQHNYPITNPLIIPKVPMFVALQTAMLGQRDVAVTTRTTMYTDMDYAIIKPYVSGGAVTISDPSNVVSVALDSTSVRTTWTAATASDGSAVTYKVERRIGSGAWTTVAPSRTTPSFLDRPLSPSTTYQYRVTASAGAISSATVTATAVTTSSSGTSVNAALSVTSGGVDAAGPVPLVVHFDFSGCSGSFTSATLDKDDGSNPIPLTVLNGGTATASIAGYDDTYTAVSSPGVFNPTVTVQDAAGNTDSASDTVATSSPSDDGTTDLLKLPYPNAGDPVSARWARGVLDQIDIRAGNAVAKDIVVQDDGQVLRTVQRVADNYPIRVERADDIFVGDGTFDPTTGVGLIATVFSGSGPTPPTGTTQFLNAMTSDADPTAGVASRTLTLPTGIPASSYAIIAAHVFGPSTGTMTLSGGTGTWTLLDGPIGNGNGNSTLRVWGKAVSSANSGEVITLTPGASALFAIGGVVYKAATGIADHDVAPNDITAQRTHPTPVTTPTQPGQMEIGIVGAKFSANGAATVNAPSGANQRAQDGTVATGVKDVSLVIWDRGLRTAQAAGDTGVAGTSVGAFSVGWSGVLTHA